MLAQVVSLLRKRTKRREEVERAIDHSLKNLQSAKSVTKGPGQLHLFDIEEAVDDPPSFEGATDADVFEDGESPENESNPKSRPRSENKGGKGDGKKTVT